MELPLISFSGNIEKKEKRYEAKTDDGSDAADVAIP